MPRLSGFPDPATHTPLIESLAELDPAESERFRLSLTHDELLAFEMDWFGTYARPEQCPPIEDDWDLLMYNAGRGWGKTRDGAETTRLLVETGQAKRIGLVARTGPDARAVMIEGPSGILTNSHPQFRPLFEPSKRQLTWPNGAIAIYYSADKPDQLRGPQFDFFWGDEPASWPLVNAMGELDAFENLLFCIRDGQDAWGLFTTTPKPSGMMLKILQHPRLRVKGGPTSQNAANLSANFLKYLVGKYANTRIGLQELEAVLLAENPDALWNMKMINDTRRNLPAPHTLRRIVIGVDPEAASTEESAETGIIAAGRDYHNHGYVLGDMTIHGKPDEWGRAVVQAYYDFEADRVIAEVNNGGEMVMHVIHSIDKRVPVRMVRATRGKVLRAEPVSAMYEQRRVHHCGEFPQLEAEMTQWTPGDKSPDRLDGLVWALSALFLGAGRISHAVSGHPAQQLILPRGGAVVQGDGVPAGIAARGLEQYQVGNLPGLASMYAGWYDGTK